MSNGPSLKPEHVRKLSVVEAAEVLRARRPVETASLHFHNKPKPRNKSGKAIETR